MTLFDIIALSILGVSTVVGLARGALREVTTVVAFLLAAFIALAGLRFTGPIARASVHPSWAANAAAVLVVFLAVYILLRVLASNLTRGVHSTRHLGAVDRGVGALFGLVRGLALLGVVNLAFNLAPPPTGLPSWIAQAKLFPLSRTCARILVTWAPKGSALAGRLTPAIAKAVSSSDAEPAPSSAIGQSDETGYARAARRGLHAAVEK